MQQIQIEKACLFINWGKSDDKRRFLNKNVNFTKSHVLQNYNRFNSIKQDVKKTERV